MSARDPHAASEHPPVVPDPEQGCDACGEPMTNYDADGQWCDKHGKPSAATLDETPRPDVVSGCFRCNVRFPDIDAGRVVVSPTGKAHFGMDGGETRCGIDATGDRWWWPL